MNSLNRLQRFALALPSATLIGLGLQDAALSQTTPPASPAPTSVPAPSTPAEGAGTPATAGTPGTSESAASTTSPDTSKTKRRPIAGPTPITPPLPSLSLGQPETRLISIDEAVRTAIMRNPSLDAAEAAIRRAQGVVAEARAFRLPRLDADVRFSLQGPIPTFTTTVPSSNPNVPPRREEIPFGRTFTRNISVLAVYDADVFGRLRLAQVRAQRLVTASQGGYYVAQNELAFSVQNVYLTALRSRELVNVSREAVEAAQEQERVARAQFRAGTAPEFDVIRASVQVANNRQQLVTAEANFRRTLASLVQILALDPLARVDLVPVALPPNADRVAISAALDVLEPLPGTPPDTIPPSVETALAEAFTRRPEVYRAEWTRRAAETQVRIERRGNYPNLDLAAAFQYNPDQAGFAVVDKTYSLVANITIPIWDAGLTRARVRQARADVDAATAQLETIRNQVTEEVKRAYIDLQEAAELRRTAAANTVQAREALRIAQVRYEAGLAQNVEVTDAQVALTQAHTNEVNAAYDYLGSLAFLNRSLGRYADDSLALLR